MMMCVRLCVCVCVCVYAQLVHTYTTFQILSLKMLSLLLSCSEKSVPKHTKYVYKFIYVW